MKKAYVIAAVLLIIACLCFALYFTYAPVRDEAPPDYSALVRLSEPEPAAETGADVQPETYRSPIDFETLWKRNPDIIAWLDIPGTDISYPILWREDDDTFYLNHNSDGEYSSLGALFAESAYNANDFSDLMTVIYGHRTRGTTMLGTLQSLYSEDGAMQDYRLVRVFLPDKELDYEVFAAMPYDSWHILDTYGSNNLHHKRVFQYELLNMQSLDGVIDEERFPMPDDPLLILSTCLTGNDNRRFLVLARQIPDD